VRQGPAPPSGALADRELVGSDNDDRAVRQAQAGARRRAHGQGWLPRLLLGPGRSQNQHRGICSPVEQRPGGRLVGQLRDQPVRREAAAGGFGGEIERHPGRGMALMQAHRLGR